MKFLFDLFPVILFFVAFQVWDIYVATGVAIAASFAQIGWLALRGKKIESMLWASLAIIVPRDRAAVVAHLIPMRFEWPESTEPVASKDRPGVVLIERREMVRPIPLDRLE